MATNASRFQLDLTGNAIPKLQQLSDGWKEINRVTKQTRKGSLKTTRVLQKLDQSTGQMAKRTQVLNNYTGKFKDTSMALNKGLAKTSGAVKKTAGAMGGLQNGMQGLATRFVGMQALLTGAIRGFHMLKDWVKESVEQFRAFEKSMAEVSTILTGDSIVAIEQVGVHIENLSVKYGQSATDIAKGMYDILSAAFDAAEGMELLNTATKASIAGLTDVTTSVDAFTSILNAWGLTTAQAGRISDELFQTVVRGKLVFSDLAKTMGYIAPIAANMGVEFKEVAAALSTVTRQGQHVDMATRGLALMIQNIGDVAPAAAKAAKQYGVDLSDVALQVGGLEYVIKDLNTAMEEHGSQVLPEMIRNMRSLRVAMALAGDEGIQGYITDLGLLEDASGRTEEAMTKMMQTSQMQADILTQSMARLERGIGEAWSGFDIWMKKAKVWWGATLSGKDGDKEVQKIDQYSRKIKKSMLELYESSSITMKQSPISDIIKGVDLSGFDTVEEKIGAVTGALIEGFDPSQINEYFDNLKLIEDKANLIHLTDIQILKGEDLLGDWENLVDEFGIGKIPADKIQELNSKAFKQGFGGINFNAIAQKEVSLEGFWDFLASGITGKGLMPGSGLMAAAKTTFSSGGAERIKDAIAGMNENAEQWEAELGVIKEMTDELAESNEELRGSVDDASMAIQDHQDNILKLEGAMKELNIQVTDTYETLGGQKFAGKMYWEAAMTGMGAALDRFSNFSQMAIKYGHDMETGYMDNINNIASGFKNLELDDLKGLDWIDQGVFEDVADMENYNGSMLDVIKTMADYVEATERIEDAQKELKSVMDETKKALLRLNLEMQKIQLKGMMRRRGLTRAEEKKIKKIQIEQTKLKIAQMEAQVEAQEEADNEMNDELESSYDKAKEIYDSYVDHMKFKLWEMGDVRDSELEDFLLNIDAQEKRLKEYGKLYTKELSSMETALISYNSLMGLIASDPDLAENYRAIYGLDALGSAEDIMQQYKDFLEKHGEPPKGDTGDGEGGDGGITPPPVEPDVDEEGFRISSVNKTQTDNKVLPYGVRVTSTSGESKVFPFPSEMVADKIADAWRALKDRGKELSWKRGTYAIPRDDIYPLHRGEQVVPAGKGAGGDTYKISIEVNAKVDTDYDVERLASKLGVSLQTKLSNNRSGKSKYRMR